MPIKVRGKNEATPDESLSSIKSQHSEPRTLNQQSELFLEEGIAIKEGIASTASNERASEKANTLGCSNFAQLGLCIQKDCPSCLKEWNNTFKRRVGVPLCLERLVERECTLKGCRDTHPEREEDTTCPAGSICVAFVLGACTLQRGPFALPCAHYHWTPSEELQYRLNGKVPRKGQALSQLKKWYLIVDEIVREGKAVVANMNRGRHSRGRDRSEKREEHHERRVSERGGRRKNGAHSKSPEKFDNRGSRRRKRDRSLSKSPERIGDIARHETRRSAYSQRTERVAERSRGRSPSRRDKRTRFGNDERSEQEARGQKKRGSEKPEQSAGDERRGTQSATEDRSREKSKQESDFRKEEERRGERGRPSNRSRDKRDVSKHSRKRSPSSRSDHSKHRQSLPLLSERHEERVEKDVTRKDHEKSNQQEKDAMPKKAAGNKKSAKQKVMSPQRMSIGEGLWIDEAADEAMELPQSIQVSRPENGGSNGAIAAFEEEAMQSPESPKSRENEKGEEKQGQNGLEGTAEVMATANNALNLLQEEYEDELPLQEGGAASAGLLESEANEKGLEDGSNRDDEHAMGDLGHDEEAKVEQRGKEEASADLQNARSAEAEEGLDVHMTAQEEVPARKEEEERATEGVRNEIAEASEELGAMLELDAMQTDIATSIELESVTALEAGTKGTEENQVAPLTGRLGVRDGALVEGAVEIPVEEGANEHDSVGLNAKEAVGVVEKTVEQERLPSSHDDERAPQAELLVQLSSLAETPAVTILTAEDGKEMPAVTILTAEEGKETETLATVDELAAEFSSEAAPPEETHPLSASDVLQEEGALELSSGGLHQSISEVNEGAGHTQQLQDKQAGAGKSEAKEERAKSDPLSGGSKHAQESKEIVLDQEPDRAQQETPVEDATMRTAVDASLSDSTNAGEIPEWLGAVLSRGWEESCEAHPRCSTRLFCPDCAHQERPICKACFEGDHEDHNVITLRPQDNDWLLLEGSSRADLNISDLPKRRTKSGSSSAFGARVWKGKPLNLKKLQYFVCATCGADTNTLGNEEAAFCSLECKVNHPAGTEVRKKASTRPTALAEIVAGSDPTSILQEKKSKQQKKGKGRASDEPGPSSRGGLNELPVESTSAAVELLTVSRALAASETAGRNGVRQEDALNQTADSRTGPPWLSALLRASFFTDCEAHAKSKNKFCIVCALDCCPSCLSENHGGHQAIQVRKSSHHDTVRVSAVEKMIDLTEVQLYVINKDRVVFLNGRPPSRSVRGNLCEICGRMLVDNVRLCSLGCKLSAIQAHPEDSALTLQAKQRALPARELKRRIAMRAGEDARPESVVDCGPKDGGRNVLLGTKEARAPCSATEEGVLIVEPDDERREDGEAVRTRAEKEMGFGPALGGKERAVRALEGFRVGRDLLPGTVVFIARKKLKKTFGSFINQQGILTRVATDGKHMVARYGKNDDSARGFFRQELQVRGLPKAYQLQPEDFQEGAWDGKTSAEELTEAAGLLDESGRLYYEMGVQPSKQKGRAGKEKAAEVALEDAPETGEEDTSLEEEGQKTRSLQTIQETSLTAGQEKLRKKGVPREVMKLFGSDQSKLEGPIGARKSRRSEVQQHLDVRGSKDGRGRKRKVSEEGKELEASGKKGRKTLQVDAMDVEESEDKSAAPLQGETSECAEFTKTKAREATDSPYVDLEHNLPPEVLESAHAQVASRGPISASQCDPAPQRTSRKRHVKEVELLSPPETHSEALLTTSGRPMRRSAETAKKKIAQGLLNEGVYERRAEPAKPNPMMTPGGSLAGPATHAQTTAYRLVTPGEALAFPRAPPGQVWVWVPTSGSADQWSYSKTWEGASGRAAIVVPLTAVYAAAAPIVQPPPPNTSETVGISSGISQNPAAFASAQAPPPPSASTQAAAKCLDTLGVAASRPKSAQEPKRLPSTQDGGVLALEAPQAPGSASSPRIRKSCATLPTGYKELEWGGNRATRSAALPTAAAAEAPVQTVQAAGIQAAKGCAAVSGNIAPKEVPTFYPTGAPAAELTPGSAMPLGTKIVGPSERSHVPQSIGAPVVASGGLLGKHGHVPEVRKGPEATKASTREAGIQASAGMQSAARAPQNGALAPSLFSTPEMFAEPQKRILRRVGKQLKVPKEQPPKAPREQPKKAETGRRIGRPAKRMSLNEAADVASPGSDVILQQQSGRTKRRKTAGTDVSKDVQKPKKAGADVSKEAQKPKKAGADISKKIPRPKKGAALQQKQAAGRSMNAKSSDLAVISGLSELGIEGGATIAKQAKARKGFAVEKIKTGQFWEDSSSDSDSKGGEEDEDEEPPEELMRICQVFKDIWNDRTRLTKTVMYIHYLKGVTMTKDYLSKSGVDDLVQNLMKFDHEWVSVAAAQLWEQWQPILKGDKSSR